MAIAIMVCLWAALLISRGTPFGDSLNSIFVKSPASALDRVDRGHFALALVVTLLAIVAISFQEPNTLRLTGLAIPDLVAWLTTFELGTSLEILGSLAAATLLLMPNRLQKRPTKTSIQPRRRMRFPRPRSRVTKRRVQKSPANDDDGVAPTAFAITRRAVGPHRPRLLEQAA